MLELAKAHPSSRVSCISVPARSMEIRMSSPPPKLTRETLVVSGLVPAMTSLNASAKHSVLSITNTTAFPLKLSGRSTSSGQGWDITIGVSCPCSPTKLLIIALSLCFATACRRVRSVMSTMRSMVYSKPYRGRPGQAYNIGNPDNEISMRDLALLFQELIPGAKYRFKEYPGEYPADEPLRRCPDITKARTELGYEPTWSLEYGLSEFIDWADTQPSYHD